MIQAQVMRMIRQKDIRDDNGELLKFGTHILDTVMGKIDRASYRGLDDSKTTWT